MPPKLKRILMKKLAQAIPDKCLNALPSRFPIIGDATIIYLNECLEPYKEAIGKAILEVLPRVKSVWVRKGETRGVFREPTLECISGSCDPIIFHRELNTIFMIDISRLTFSPGNRGEREKLTRIIKPNEIVIDMFACCGNLSLPIAVNCKPRMIFGIEINPYAYGFLIDNIRINNVSERYVAILGDNKISTLEKVADHVLMGFFNIDDNQLEAGLKAIKEDGGIIHYHFIAYKKAVKKKVDEILEKVQGLGFFCDLLCVDKVKSYAPNVLHYVARIEITP
ncbi:MAG: class I SAM-dependent methyltransferase [Candidatus Njordarchaeia archaeon]